MRASFPSLRPNTFVYTAVISALASANQWELALEHFEKMKALAKADPDVRPNQYTFSAVISACGRGGKLDTALALYEEMRGTPGLQVTSACSVFALQPLLLFKASLQLWGYAIQ